MKLIAAADNRWGLGRNDHLLIRIPDDLKNFRRLTMCGTVILGRRTLQTFPHAAPLTGRDNIILSADPSFDCAGATVVRSVPELLKTVKNRPADTVWAIGGASIYRQLLPYCSEAVITRIKADLDADCFLPDLDASPSWQLVSTSPGGMFEGIEFYFAEYRNIAPLV